ncbi:MAG: hypothetical protein SGCHY_001913 [Lobulomycetales sp.]
MLVTVTQDIQRLCGLAADVATIDHRQVIKLAPAGLGPSLLRKSSIYLEPPRKRERSAQLKALLDTTRRQLENAAYKKSLERVFPQTAALTTAAASLDEVKQVNRLLYSLVNILFSAIAVFSASMYASSSYTWRWGIEARVLGSLLATLLVVGAEGYFFFRDWSAMAESGQGRRGRRRARGPRAKQD